MQILKFIVIEFRECFYLFARSGQIRTLDELTIIMRSLGLSPTIAELNKYMKDKGNGISEKIHCLIVIDVFSLDFRWKNVFR